MRKCPRSLRLSLALLGVVAFAGTMGQRCAPPGGPIFPPGGQPIPVVDFVVVELVNFAGGPVDPGLFVDGFATIVDPPIAPGDSVIFEVDCFVGTRIESDALLLTGFGAIPSDNIAVVDEGFDFLCGDTVSFIYAEDLAGFFINVEIFEGF